MIYNLKDLQKVETRKDANGKYVPARYINYKYRTLMQRLKESYLLFIGKVDCFTWPEDEDGM